MRCTGRFPDFWYFAGSGQNLFSYPLTACKVNHHHPFAVESENGTHRALMHAFPSDGCAIFYIYFLFRLDFIALSDIANITLLSAAAELRGTIFTCFYISTELSTLAQTACCPVRQTHGDSISKLTAHSSTTHQKVVGNCLYPRQPVST